MLLLFYGKSMKKNKLNNGSVKKTTTKEETKVSATEKAQVESLDEDNQGFGGWLRSDDGMENMKLFVIANSILLLTTLVFPHLKTTIEILGEMVYGVTEEPF